MRKDQIYLRIMLGALAATALTGVAAIFTSGHDVTWRLLGTGTVATVAAGLMWLFAHTAEKPATRLAGLVGMGGVLCEFVLLLVILWKGFFWPTGAMIFERNLDRLLDWPALFLPLTGGAAVTFLLFWNHAGAWLAARVGVAAAAATFAEVLLATWFDGSHFLLTARENWFAAAGASSLFGVLSVACLTGTLQERPWRWAGVLSALIGWAIMTVHALQATQSQLGESVFALITTLAVVVAYVNLCSLPSLSAGQELVRVITYAMAVLTAVLTDWLILHAIYFENTNGGFNDFLGRLAAAAGIVTACGTVAVMILAKLNRKHLTAEPTAASAWLDMDIVCPACERRQRIPLGASKCCECRLPFSIRVGVL